MSAMDWLIAFGLWAVAMWRVEACYRRLEVVDGDETWEPVDCDDSGEDWKLN